MVQWFSGRNEFEVCKKEERSQCGPNVEGSGDKNDFFFKNSKVRQRNGSLIMQGLVGQVKGFMNVILRMTGSL